MDRHRGGGGGGGGGGVLGGGGGGLNRGFRVTHGRSQYLWLHNILKPLVVYKNDSNIITFVIFYAFFVLVASAAFKAGHCFQLE